MNKTWGRESKNEDKRIPGTSYVAETHTDPRYLGHSVELQGQPTSRTVSFHYCTGLDSFCLPVNNSLKRVIKEI